MKNSSRRAKDAYIIWDVYRRHENIIIVTAKVSCRGKMLCAHNRVIRKSRVRYIRKFVTRCTERPLYIFYGNSSVHSEHGKVKTVIIYMYNKSPTASSLLFCIRAR